MKKVFAIALAVIMMLSVVLGCGGKKAAQPSPSQTKITESQNTNSRNKPLQEQMTRLTAQLHPGPK